MKFYCLFLIALLTAGPLAAQEPLSHASGSWYQSSRNGEGFVVQVLPNGLAALTWFTYPPEGESGEQAWIMGLGTYAGNRIIVTDMERPVGGVFGPEFDPETIIREKWGTLEMEFKDCNTATVYWNGPSAFGSGSMDVTRLSAIDDLRCGTEAEPEPDRVIAGRSGPWYDRSHNGEGWMLEMLEDGRMAVYWFTYDDMGQQAWLAGVAKLEGDTLWVEDLFSTRGTNFGSAFNKDDVEIVHWGSFGMLFEDCLEGKIRYASVDERFGEGTLEPVRLAYLAETDCTEPPPATPLTGGSWQLSTDLDVAMSESASATAGGFVYTGGGFAHRERLQRFDPSSGTYTEMPGLPEPRHHPMMTTDGHNIYMAGGYGTRGFDVIRNNLWLFNPDAGEWEILPNLPSGRAAGAATYMHSRVWILGGEGAGTVNYFYDINTGEWGQFPGDPRMVYDHMQAVAFENEIWWMGGRTELGTTFNQVLIWNPVTQAWREGPAMNYARAGFAAKVVQGQIIVTGGEQLSASPPLVVTSTEVFAPGAESWAIGLASPIAIHGNTGAVINGKLVLTAGSNIAGQVGQNRATQILTPALPPQ